MSDLFSGMSLLETEGKARPTSFDLRYKQNTARFRFSAQAVEALNFTEHGNGIVVAINDAASVAMIGILPKEKAQLLKAKTPEFTHPLLRAKLDAWIGRVEDGKDSQNFRLTEVGVHGGVAYFKIEAWNNASGLIDIQAEIPGAGTVAALPTVESTEPEVAADANVVSADTVTAEEAPIAEATPAAPSAEEDPEALFADLD